MEVIRKVIRGFNQALDDGLPKAVFDHVRNFLVCAFLLAIGTTEYRDHSGLMFGLIPGQYSGAGIIVIACLLFALNLYDGISKLSRFGSHRALILLMVVLYIVLAMRVVEIAWNFQAGS